MNNSTNAQAEPLGSGVYRSRRAHDGWPKAPVPQPADLDAAIAVVREVWPPTPLVFSVQLSRIFDREIYLKLENLAPVRSFKFRGALVAVAGIAAERPGAHIYTASTGNHGQGMAYAAGRLGVAVTVYSPRTALADKVDAMRGLGATVIIEGDDLSHAAQAAEHRAVETGGAYVEDGEDPRLMSGAATVTSEVIEAAATLDTFLVPVGGGNLIAGSLLSLRHHGPDMSIVGVQSTAASGATASWLAREVVSRPCETFAGGLATQFPGELSWRVMDQWLETMALVDEPDLYSGVATAFRQTGLIVEGAAAAPIAALMVHGDDIPGDRVGLLVTGSWLSVTEFGMALES